MVENMKRIIRIIGLTIVVFIAFHIVLTIYLGRIDYGGTLDTKYQRNDSTKTISTNYFKIETPKNWYHVFHGYGEEGTPFGLFLTPKGKMEYDYGYFPPSFEIDSIFTFSAQTITANRFEVRIAINNKNETGIFIDQQNEMKWPLSFFMSEACTKNLNKIVEGIREMDFKKN